MCSVGSCLYYSLDSSRVTINGFAEFRVLVQQQLRAISRMPTRFTLINNQELLAKLGVEEPGAHIQQLTQIKAQTVIGQWRRQVLSAPSGQLQLELRVGRNMLQCPHCGLECVNRTVPGSRISSARAATSKLVNEFSTLWEGAWCVPCPYRKSGPCGQLTSETG